MRIKITVIALLLELILLAWQKPLIASAAVKMIEKVQQVIPVTLQEPAQFWRAGKQEEANEAVILKMKINLPFDWFTRNSRAPAVFVWPRCLPSVDLTISRRSGGVARTAAQAGRTSCCFHCPWHFSAETR